MTAAAPEAEGPHMDWCPLRRPRGWRDRYDPFATCMCSHSAFGRMMRSLAADPSGDSLTWTD